MKKMHTIILSSFFVLGLLSSCSKDRTCTCRSTSSGNVISTTKMTGTDDEAKAACNSYAGGAIVCTLD